MRCAAIMIKRIVLPKPVGRITKEFSLTHEANNVCWYNLASILSGLIRGWLIYSA